MLPLLAFCLLVLIVGLLPDGLPSAGFWWDFLTAAGYCGLVVIAFLGWDSESPATNPRLRLHRNLAVASLLLCIVHSLGYLILDPTLTEYLLPAAPAYMLAGIVAFLSLLLVTTTSFPTPRRRLYPSFSTFRSGHRILFLVILAGSVWHTVGTDFSLTAFWQTVAIGILLGLLPAIAYVARRIRRQPPMTRVPFSTSRADRASLYAGVTLLSFCAGYAWIKALACDGC